MNLKHLLLMCLLYIFCRHCLLDVELLLAATSAAAAAVVSTSAVASVAQRPLMRQEITITFRQVVNTPPLPAPKCLPFGCQFFSFLITFLVCYAIKVAHVFTYA